MANWCAGEGPAGGGLHARGQLECPLPGYSRFEAICCYVSTLSCLDTLLLEGRGISLGESGGRGHSSALYLRVSRNCCVTVPCRGRTIRASEHPGSSQQGRRSAVPASRSKIPIVANSSKDARRHKFALIRPLQGPNSALYGPYRVRSYPCKGVQQPGDLISDWSQAGMGFGERSPVMAAGLESLPGACQSPSPLSVLSNPHFLIPTPENSVISKPSSFPPHACIVFPSPTCIYQTPPAPPSRATTLRSPAPEIGRSAGPAQYTLPSTLDDRSTNFGAAAARNDDMVLLWLLCGVVLCGG